jgi:hypothetical protein
MRMTLVPNIFRESLGRSNVSRRGFPWILAAIVFVVVMAVGYSFDTDRSQSEREGVVTQTEAENDVIPSLPPE